MYFFMVLGDATACCHVLVFLQALEFLVKKKTSFVMRSDSKLEQRIDFIDYVQSLQFVSNFTVHIFVAKILVLI